MLRDLTILLMLLLGMATAEDRMLLDERWETDLTLGETALSVAEREGPGDPRVRFGDAAAELSNATGAPHLRFRNAGRVKAGQLVPGETELRLWYRTESWDGRWTVELWAWHRDVSERTFKLMSGALDGGGLEERLIADGEWHEARAVLLASEHFAQVEPAFQVPLFVMLAPQSGWDVEHTTYVDRVMLTGLADPDQTAVPYPPIEFSFAERIERPAPEVDGHLRRVEVWESIQAQLDAAEPGDVITLAAGIYHERLRISRSGTADAPIILRAEEPGTATITGEPENFILEFDPMDGDLYRAPVPWRVRWVMADQRNLTGYEDLQGLRTFMMTGHDSRVAEHGPPEGFAWEDGFLYVRLLAGADPRNANFRIHGPYEEAEAALSPIDYWGAPFRDRNSGGELILVEGDHVAISGLRLRMAPEVGVRVTGGNVSVRDCRIDGAFRGILAGEAANLTVERCEFDCYPVYQWVRWGQSEYPNRRNAVWNAVYNSNLFATFLEHSGPGAIVRRNLVYECFDAIQRHCHDRDRRVTRETASEISYNAIFSCADECIEFDSTGPQNLRVHHNFFMDALALLALSPVQGGALQIDHNIIYASPDYGLMPCTLLKFDCPWRTAWLNTPTRDCRIVHNTFVNGRAYLYWTGEDHTFVNNTFENNILWVRLSFPWKIEQLRPGPHNLYAGPNVDPEHMPGLIIASEAGFVSEPAEVPLRAPRLPAAPLAGLVAPEPDAARADTQVDFRLTPGSPAVDAGVKAEDSVFHHEADGEAPDLGALEHGDQWEFPRPGPSWSVGRMAPWRPPLPPSLDPRWVGLGEAGD